MTNEYTTGSEIKARVAKHEESERKLMGDILKVYSSVLNGKGYNGLRLKDAQRLMNMSCSEVAEKASLNTNPI